MEKKHKGYLDHAKANKLGKKAYVVKICKHKLRERRNDSVENAGCQAWAAQGVEFDALVFLSGPPK